MAGMGAGEGVGEVAGGESWEGRGESRRGRWRGR